jgi:gamma-glutamyltranspeptidase/glutathione hydrolase
MTPTIVTKNGRPLIVTGSPGGSRIITSVLQVVVNLIDRNMDVAEAVSAPRIHHQWSPDRVIAEQGLPNDVVTALEGLGHKIERRPYGGTSANTILVTPRGFAGAADPRTRGSLAAGY